MKFTHFHLAALAVLLSLSGLAACGDSGNSEAAFTPPVGSEQVKLDPADFTTEIDNPYWPMRPGSRWVYREPGEKGRSLRVEITVTDKTKIVDGIEARVVHDVVSDERTKRPVEVTDDWYAQDKHGNVWYLGEATQEYENGKPTTTKGSWEAGVDGAQAGVIVLADPQAGDEYRQEYLAGQAEDAARVLSLDERIRVPLDAYENCLMTRDFTPLDPDVLENKYYAKGVGPVLTIDVPTGDREELVSFEAG
ncbi:MAG: hypothetical protein HZB14_05780 [Actinobacteria bacterium]|nr:hypothetical protein [Actinomycetota bacterium]